MAKAKPVRPSQVQPEDALWEGIVVPEGEPRYWFLLNDEIVESLARGVCPEILSRGAYTLLEWKREANRVTARQLYAEVEAHV